MRSPTGFETKSFAMHADAQGISQDFAIETDGGSSEGDRILQTSTDEGNPRPSSRASCV
jgi:hypothetical protein